MSYRYPHPSYERGSRGSGGSGRSHRPLSFAVPAILTLAAVSLIGAGAASFANEQTRTCTVTGTDRTRDSEGRSDMRAYTEQCGTLGVGDLWLRGQFESADIYGQLDPGATYEVTTVGWRIPLLSRFETVLGDPTPVEASAP